MDEKEPRFNPSLMPQPTPHASEGSGHVEEEPHYKEVADMKFDTRLDENLVMKFIKEYTVGDSAQEARKRTEERSFFEHAVVGGSADHDNHPLTPYALLDNKMTAQEVALARDRSGKSNRTNIMGGLDLRSLGISERETGRIVLKIDPQVEQEFLTVARQAREKALQDRPDLHGSVGCEFSRLTLDQQTGRITMPYLTKLRKDELPEKFRGKIRLKEWIWQRGDDVVVVIDQNGFRFDHPDSHPRD